MRHTYTLKEGTPEYVGDILSALETQSHLNATWQRCFEAYQDEIGRLWADNAELRDELHAVANRVETLTRALTTAPAEVAAAIVNDANRSIRDGRQS